MAYDNVVFLSSFRQIKPGKKKQILYLSNHGESLPLLQSFHGILVECATDNPTRTVANVRMYFNRNNGELGKTGSLDFAFTRRGVFRIIPGEHKMEDLEFSLIDFGLEEIYEDEGNYVILTAFQDFGLMQKGLEEFKIELIKAESQRIPNTTTKLTPEQEEEILDLIDKFEQDDDVSAVYHTMGN